MLNSQDHASCAKANQGTDISRINPDQGPAALIGRLSSTKPEAAALSRRRLDCPPHVGEDLVNQAEEFTCLRNVYLKEEGKAVGKAARASAEPLCGAAQSILILSHGCEYETSFLRRRVRLSLGGTGQS